MSLLQPSVWFLKMNSADWNRKIRARHYKSTEIQEESLCAASWKQINSVNPKITLATKVSNKILSSAQSVQKQREELCSSAVHGPKALICSTTEKGAIC